MKYLADVTFNGATVRYSLHPAEARAWAFIGADVVIVGFPREKRRRQR